MNARDLARRVLQRVDEGAYATLALSGELGRSGGLAPADRGLTTELVYGVLKRRRRLDWALAAYAPRGLDKLDERVRDALRLGAYQMLFLRVPAHAAVDDAVGAIKRLRGQPLANFANALLRRLGRDGEPAPPREPVAQLGVLESAPDWLVTDALARFGPEEARAYLAALNQPAPMWLRANTLRTTRAQAMAQLAEERPTARLTASPLLEEAFRVDGGGDPAAARVFLDGLATPQDLAAQKVAHLVNPQPGERILDACAGVGGKSAHLAALAQDRLTIDSADLSERKLELARELCRRLGVTATRSIRCDLTDAQAPLAESYDRVLLDAPCSGLGVLRRHPEAKWRRQPDDAQALAGLQARLIDALVPRVRPGGIFVYSVCTYSHEEGVQQLARLRERHPQLEQQGEPLTTWPHRDDADAFFAVRLRRRDA